MKASSTRYRPRLGYTKAGDRLHAVEVTRKVTMCGKKARRVITPDPGADYLLCTAAGCKHYLPIWFNNPEGKEVKVLVNEYTPKPDGEPDDGEPDGDEGDDTE